MENICKLNYLSELILRQENLIWRIKEINCGMSQFTFPSSTPLSPFSSFIDQMNILIMWNSSAAFFGGWLYLKNMSGRSCVRLTCIYCATSNFLNIHVPYRQMILYLEWFSPWQCKLCHQRHWRTLVKSSLCKASLILNSTFAKKSIVHVAVAEYCLQFRLYPKHSPTLMHTCIWKICI